MTEGLILAAAAAIVGTARSPASPVGSVSLVVTARALGTIDLMIAKCEDIALVDLSDSGGPRSYEMATTPIRVEALSGDPVVVIRATGVAERTDLALAVRFEFKDSFGTNVLAFHNDFGAVPLTTESPAASLRLPLRSFRSEQ
jgi:hypothetical protein